jgi:uncharacterized protein
VDPPRIPVEIVFAQPQRARILTLSLEPGATVADALKRAGGSAEFAGLNLSDAPVGIFGRIVSREQLLKPGDRLEIYRPLAADPKTARRKRLASKSGRS